MKFYSQKDPRWKDYKYYGNYTIGGYGCFITALAMLDGRTPPEVADIIKNAGGFTTGGYMNSEIAGRALGLEYNGRSNNPEGVCIAETNYYAPNYPQHFFVWLGGEINDPLLDHGNTVNNYNIVSYRLFKKKEEQMCKIDEQKALDMRRHLVFKTFNMILGREGEPDEKTIVDNADWIDRDSGDSFNYQGMANWVVDLYNSNEANKHRECEDNHETIEKMRADYHKEMVRMQKIIDDKKKSLDELESLKDAEIAKREKKIAKLEKKLDKLTEIVKIESIIWNWIKNLFGRK